MAGVQKVLEAMAAQQEKLEYRKPVYDKLGADGSILGYGLAVEDVKTSGDFTHFVWIVAKDLAGLAKTRAAFAADGQQRSQEERDGRGDSNPHGIATASPSRLT